MVSWQEILIRLAVAACFGALIGLERERKDWTAGMRTHMMVCVGSCLIMLVSAYGFADVLGKPNVMLDPSRVAAQVVSGIGFIGAGTILFLKQGAIRGLTTAAGLWTVAAIGLATGGGMYFAASSTTIIALIILWALQPLERIYARKFKQRTLQITTGPGINNAELFQRIMSNNNFTLENFVLDKVDGGFVYQIKFDPVDADKIMGLMDDLKDEPAIKEIHWQQ